MTPARYKGFTITPRTFQIRGSGRWTLDLLIGQRELLRAFTGGGTYGTEAAAEAGCLAFGQRIIDGSHPGCPLAGLTQDLAPCRVLQFRPRSAHHPPSLTDARPI